MKTVSFVCEKCGVGETALAEEFYYFCLRQEVSVASYSIDGQYETRNHPHDAPEIVIVDTAGYINRDFEDAIARSDVVVVPVQPSFNDIEPFLRTLSLVERVNPSAGVLIVVNRLTRFTMSKRFMEWLVSQDLGYRIAEVYQSEPFAQYIGSGESVVGNERSGRITADIQRMNHAIFDLLSITS